MPRRPADGGRRPGSGRPWGSDAGRGSASRWGSDRGSGSVLVLVVVAVTVLLTGALGMLVGAQVARSRAQAAADLGALAAAEHLLRGRAGPCAVARDVVERNGAVLASCTVEGGGVVAVRSTAAAPVGDATARASAGPRRAGPG
ncbi:Rv3654c family TadE-like protein [Cellulomonas sp. Marseille-Q8402]